MASYKYSGQGLDQQFQFKGELRHYVHADRPLVAHMPRAKTMGADTRGNLQTVPRYRKEVRQEFKHYILAAKLSSDASLAT